MRAYRLVGAFACVGKCRSYGAQFAFVCVYPGFHIGLCPHFTLGFAGVSPLQGSLSYWAFAELCRGIVFVVFIPLGHLLAWVSAAPTELNLLLSVCTQGFISGFALIPPWAMQECRPCRALCRIGRLRCCVVVLCSLNVFGCVNGLLRSFVFLFDCDCMGCGGGLFGGIVGAVG